MLVERIHELEDEVASLRSGVPHVDEATVRSFLTQMDMAYTESLEADRAVTLLHADGTAPVVAPLTSATAFCILHSARVLCDRN